MSNISETTNMSNMSNINIQVIIPTYHASGTIEVLIRELEKALSNYHLKIILVDDASTDDTTSIILNLADEFKNIIFYFSKMNKGQQASLHTGLNLLTEPCDYVITMDDDLQNPVEIVEELIEKIQTGYDLVFAVPVHDIIDSQSRPSLFRRFGSMARDLLFDSLTKKNKGVQVSSFRIMTYILAKKIASSNKKYFYLSAEAFQHNIEAGNIFYHYVPRYAGNSSYTLIKLFYLYLKLLLTYKWNLIK